MVKISTIFVLGIVTVLVQFSGFPMGFKNFLYIACGISVTVLSLLIRRELHEVLKHLHTGTTQTDTVSESAPKQQESTQ